MSSSTRFHIFIQRLAQILKTGAQLSGKDKIFWNRLVADAFSPEDKKVLEAFHKDPENEKLQRRLSGLLSKCLDSDPMLKSFFIEMQSDLRDMASRRSPDGMNRPNSGQWTAPPAPPAMAPMASPPEEKPPVQPATISCYFKAEMPREILPDEIQAIAFTLSRIPLLAGKEGAADSGSSKVRTDQRMTISVRPIQNMTIVGSGSVQQEVPGNDLPVLFAFTVKALGSGPCQVAIDIWQEQILLCCLKLSPECLAKTQSGERITALANSPTALPYPEPLDQLRITERREGNEFYYVYDLDARKLGILKSFESPRMQGDRLAYINNLYQQLESLWVTTGDDAAQLESRLKNWGASLFSSLMPADLQKILWNNLERIKSIQVMSTEPFIPWELLFIKEPGMRIGPADKFFGELGLTRWLYGWANADRLTLREGKAKYAIPEYKDPKYRLPLAELEKTYLKENFHASEINASPEEILAAIHSPGSFDLLHLSCHGQADPANISNASLRLEEHQAGDDLIPTYLMEVDILGTGNLPAADGVRPMVVLNACQSARMGKQLVGFGGFAKAFLDIGAALFIGALWAVEDHAAVTFMTTFYDALKNNKNLSEATIMAREESRKGEGSTWLAYVVYGNPFATLDLQLQ